MEKFQTVYVSTYDFSERCQHSVVIIGRCCSCTKRARYYVAGPVELWMLNVQARTVATLFVEPDTPICMANIIAAVILDAAIVLGRFG